MKPLIIPTVNLNGTSRDELVGQLLDVQSALRAVRSAMGKAMPHGRDYLPSALDGERKDAQARDAFYERIEVLMEMEREMEKHALAIHAQGQNRR